VLRFDGFLKVYEVVEEKGDDDDESKNKLPSLDDVKTLALEKLDPEDHFTSPLPRYNEASLVKILEERGNRASVDLRVDHQYNSGSRKICHQDHGTLLPHRDWRVCATCW